MASKNKVGIIIGVSVVLIGVTAFFIYRGIKSQKDAMDKLKASASEPPIKDVIGNTTQTQPITDATSTTTTTPTTQTSPIPNAPTIQPKSQSILRKTPSTLSAKLTTFGSGVQIKVEGVLNSGGYTWYKITDPTTKLQGFIRGDVVSVIS